MSKQVKIEKLVYGGAGLGRLDGKTIFVPFTAPGDLVKVKITKAHKGYDEAELIDILEPATCRVSPPCSYYGVCGGCHYQHINYAQQILWKQLILEEQLSRLSGLREMFVLPTIVSPVIWEYRSRIQIHKKGGKIGFCKANTNEIIDIESCLVAEASLNIQLKKLRNNWPSSDTRMSLRAKRSRLEPTLFTQINPYANKKLKELIRQWAGEEKMVNILELYAGSGNLTFELASLASKIIAVESDKAAVSEGKTQAKSSGIKNIEFIESTAENFLRNDTLRQAQDEREVSLAQGEREVSLVQGEREVSLVQGEREVSLVQDEREVSLAQGEREVSLVQGEREVSLVQDGHKNNPLTLSLSKGESLDLVLVDPPREGLGKKVVSGISKLKPKRIIYVSCNPSTLARDLGELSKSGYKPEKIQPIDMFPQTYHIESISLLKRI